MTSGLRLSRIALVPAAVCLALLQPVTAAVADGPDKEGGKKAAPPMSIEISDGVDKAASGDKLAYRIIVHNQGGEALGNLRIEQRAPETAGRPEASEGGQVGRSGVITWTADVKAGTKAEFTSRIELGRTDQKALRAASTACAFLDGAKAPTVCASDLDTLPGGAAGPEGTTAGKKTGGIGTTQLALGGAAVAGIAALSFVAVRRRRANAS
ncbi:LPXTG cell wall anchor domain-containing protein [Streptomyces acidiscabies]|uniref:LPXTG cell wall anchor domain-containing protein n=1 Tax=Streptomyces acidiscabies TaxID=42234 RepID=A0AAP6BBP7_9ACTN|nr:LPXTG cell wall anchor domain-containing protein [Streptomyces acidiscabies]MBP5938139.1 DUF4139 domain-containing protein [Streptomyces sp. LBUM 1476]MBZ3909149.1 LPXTG cell wall anchor domain-containing protein [Streptomyces acidiscabies]MDX2961688.1 LPXTG cell wall anchor domain-containing protein [Streptomyces acidiscabies]MDX3016443.1 LPXTG cell wall anchor domain-containing protein [Streptomyces acidiscabies]MDX3788651.1 LPXTG cell wall anchor domain-containing protein [Streptomyces a